MESNNLVHSYSSYTSFLIDVDELHPNVLQTRPHRTIIDRSQQLSLVPFLRITYSHLLY